MAKIRVYELARDLKIESKSLVNRLKDLGFDVASHQSTLSGSDLDRIKTIFGNSIQISESPEAAPAQAAAPAGGQQIVVRRRRRVEGEGAQEGMAGSEASDAPISASSDTPAASGGPTVIVRKRPGQSSTGTGVAADEEAAAAGWSTAEPTHSAPSEPPADSRAAASAMPREDGEQRQESPHQENLPGFNQAGVSLPGLDGSKEAATHAAPTPSVAGASSGPSAGAAVAGASAAQSVNQPLKRIKPEFTSATVVRRATLEERAELQKKEMQNYSSGSGASGAHSVRHEDSRGTRITGMSYPGMTNEEQIIVDDALLKKQKKKAADEAEEAEAARRAKPQPKSRRQHLSTRDLLANTDDEGDVEIEETPTVAPTVVPANVRNRTVYTPSASAGRRNLKRRKDLKQTSITTPRAAYRIVKMGAVITVAEFAKQLSVKAVEIIKKLMSQGEMVTINSNLDFDTAALLANDYGFEVKNTSTDISDIIKTKALEDYADEAVITRPPIVTVMGHVDHGKTSILDAIRQTSVASGEAGGITQHIGAYTVERNGRTIAFLDTPGHEAFSNMRARGAKLTDIVVLVVAADDGVMPQTIESISHARDAEVPIIVAINKIDKPNINLDRIFTELAAYGVQPEDWGGDNQFIKVSALEKTGINELLEAVLLQAEILELQAAPDAPAEGRVVEAYLDKGRGPVSTVMVTNGTLHVGDYIVAGSEFGKVRAMFDHAGKSLEKAGPSTPVLVVGLSGVPAAGEPANAVEDEKTAKSAAEWRAQQKASTTQKSAASNLDALLSKIKSAEAIEVPLIVKADTHGSIEAIADAILKLNENKSNVHNKIVHKGVGGITGSDISLAATSGALLIAFNVRANKILEEDADRSGVVIQYFSIIYDIVDAVKSMMSGKLPPILSENIQGHAEVKQPISVPKFGTIAGSSVIDGKITRSSNLRLIRDNVVIYSGKVKSLRRFKDDVKEVASGYECGISIEGYNDVKEGDVIEAYVVEETAATLQI